MKFISSVIAVLGLSIASQAQILELTPSAGYMFNGKIQFVEGVIDLKNAPSFGLSLSTASEGDFDVELDYTWALNTDLEFKSSGSLAYPDFTTQVNVHQVTLNAINYLGRTETIRPFFNLGAGVSIFDIAETGVEDPVRLSLNIGVGLKYDINDRLGFRVQSRLIAPVHFEGVGLYAGIGTGGSSAGVSLNASVPIFEADVRAGLIIKLGQ